MGKPGAAGESPSVRVGALDGRASFAHSRATRSRMGSQPDSPDSSLSMPNSPEFKLRSVKHVNYPNVGDEHAPEDCPGTGPWPCNRLGSNQPAHRASKERSKLPKYPSNPAIPEHKYGQWSTPFGLDDPPEPIRNLIEEWDGDRIDDRILIDFLAEVAEIPIPDYLTSGSYLARNKAQEVHDLRRYYPVLVARAVVRAWVTLEEDDELPEHLEEELSPKVVLNSAIIWDRG